MKLFFYQLKNILKTKEVIFWTMAFPLLLGTLFYVSFGTADVDDKFSKIPVGIVWNEENEYFSAVLDEIEGELFVTTDYEEKEAIKALREEKIDAYIVVDDTISMKVMESSVEASIVETFLDEYISSQNAIESIIEDTIKEHPEKMSEIGEMIAQNSQELGSQGNVTVKNDAEDAEDYNPYLVFFFALVAMTCLFGSFLSQGVISELQADQSAVGARKNIAPLSKMKLLIIDILTTWLVSFVEILIVLGYLVGILGLNFGANLGYMLILAVVGSYFGISLGIFVAIFVKGDFGAKNGFLVAFNLVLCFFGGLMMVNVIDLVEHHIPILNRINPAALMVHAFQSLQIYKTPDIFYRNLGIIFVFGIVMNIASVWILRRKKYASL